MERQNHMLHLEYTILEVPEFSKNWLKFHPKFWCTVLPPARLFVPENRRP
jgi:hypothetical protein